MTPLRRGLRAQVRAEAMELASLRERIGRTSAGNDQRCANVSAPQLATRMAAVPKEPCAACFLKSSWGGVAWMGLAL